MIMRFNSGFRLRAGLLSSTALAAALWANNAHAVCSPPSGDNVVATCTGATVNQDAFIGYGNLGANNLSVTVVPGASVTGTVDGIHTGPNGSVTNAGTINGVTQDGVFVLDGSTLRNSGTVTGALRAVTGTNITVVNTGTLTGSSAISATGLNLTNSGTITATTFFGIVATTAAVENSGTITGTGRAFQIQSGTVNNSGTISNTGGAGSTAVFGNTSLTVNNSGTITSPGNAILSNNIATVTNSGNINATESAILTGGALTVANSGTITSASAGVASNGTATLNNSGSILTTGSALIAVGAISVTNSGTLQSSSAADAIEGFTTGTVTNSGRVEGTGAFANALRTGGSATVTNTGTMIGGSVGVQSAGLNLNNSGLIQGRSFEGVISTLGLSLTNTGTIQGGRGGILASVGGTVFNIGSITGTNGDGINHGQTLNLLNGGNIFGTRHGVGAQSAPNVVNVTNTGTIAGGAVGVRANGSGNVTNSGTIVGLSGTAVQFGAVGGPASDVLTVQRGARFGGLVDFGGGADTVNFTRGNWVLDTANFNAAASTVNAAGNPLFVTPNQIVVVDTSSFGVMNRAFMDITGWIASVLPDTPRPIAGAPGALSAFAPEDSIAVRFEDAFAAMPQGALGYMPTKALPFKSGTAAYADGSTVWAKGFGGRREQADSATIFGNVTTGYGGAIGYEHAFAPDLRIGVFGGASTNSTTVGFNVATTDTDVVFGGVYGRAMRGATFLDLALIGGVLDNSATRIVGGGLAPVTASASYDGWFINPSLALGHGFALEPSGATTLTPAVKVRYVAAHFDGYTETGLPANLTVGGRDFRGVEERAELTLANTRDFSPGNRLTMRMTGGFLAQQRTEGATVNLSVLGQNLLVATPDKADTAGAFGSAGFDWQIGRVLLFAAGEITATDDANRTMSAKGGVRVVW